MAPARLGAGGLGQAASEFVDGSRALGRDTDYVGLPTPDARVRLLSTTVSRRLLGTAQLRRATLAGVRRAVPREEFELIYAVPGTMPEAPGRPIRVICQTTRHPSVELALNLQAERETGGRGDLSAAEARYAEQELRRVDLIHVTTHAVRAEFIEAGFAPERLVQAYHSVDVEVFRPHPKPADLRIGYVGPLSLRKGVDVVAELAAALRGRATITAVGGPKCPWSRRISESAGFDHQKSVVEMLGQAQLLVLPSRSDGFAYVVLEAMASGCVPIVTPEVGAAEVVRRLDERLVIERADFVDGVLGLLDTLDIDELARRARELALEFDRRTQSVATVRTVLDAANALRAGG